MCSLRERGGESASRYRQILEADPACNAAPPGEIMRRTDLVVPPITSTAIVLTKWNVEDRGAVKRGSTVCEFDVSSPFGDGVMAQSSFAYEAPVGGILQHAVSAESSVQIGQIVGWIKSHHIGD